MKRVIIFGGYGVFGSQVARALAAWGTPLTIAGRNLPWAEALARELGGDCRAREADVTEIDSCRAAVAGHRVAVNCAGPFQALDTTLLEACLDARCHYTDIADDRDYTARVRAYHDRLVAAGICAVHGCSSLPGISGALASLALESATAPVTRARVTLFIGNKNPKGEAALRSFLAGLGKPIAAPQGTLFGFRDREIVPLPAPFGRRGVFNIDSPEYDLFPSLLGTPAVTVKAGFELRLATYAFAALARIGRGCGSQAARLLKLPGRVLSWLGCSGGAVMTELFQKNGPVQRAALAARRDGQRLAALPCALVVRALCDDASHESGIATAYEFLGAARLLQELVSAGFEIHQDARGPTDTEPLERSCVRA